MYIQILKIYLQQTPIANCPASFIKSNASLSYRGMKMFARGVGGRAEKIRNFYRRGNSTKIKDRKQERRDCRPNYWNATQIDQSIELLKLQK